MSYKELKEQIAQADELTKQGKKAMVIPLLESIRNTKPPTEFLPALGRLANRNGASILSLKILFPEIQKERERIKSASPEALAVYSNSLLNIGALEEARELADRVLHLNETKLLRAFIEFARWDYEKALPYLKGYIQGPDLSPYQNLVGQVNIVAALIGIGNFREARTLLNSLIEQLKQGPSGQLLLANCYELISQVDIFDHNYKQAREHLGKARLSLSSYDGRYLLYVRKWLGVLDLTQNPKNIEPLLRVKKEAIQLRNWETLRDCDFHLARLTGNATLLQRIYLGTPYESFRARLGYFYNIYFERDEVVQYCPQDISSDPKRIILDLENKRQWSGAGATTVALLQVMTRDFYRPPRMGVIFSALYQKEKFNPFTSIQRIRNSLIRFNHWAKINQMNLRVSVEKGDFFLKTQTGDGLSLKIKNRPLPLWRIRLSHFRQIHGARTFKASDLGNELRLSLRTSNSLIRTGLSHNVLEKIGQGRSTCYLFSSSRKIRQS